MSRVEQVQSDNDGAPARRPHLHDLWAALGLLTAVHVDRPDIRSAAAAPATLFFPVVGGLVGLLLVGANWIMGERLPAIVSAVVLVGLWEAISGGTALQACGGVAMDHGKGATALAASGVGASPAGRPLVGMIAALLLIKVALLAHGAASRPAAVLFAPMLARWAMVVLAVGARDAAAPSRKLNAAITFREFALTSVFTCAVVFTVAEALGILLVVSVAALTLALRLLQHRRAGGTSWPLLLTSAELVELLVLAIAAGLSPAA
jgi:adenosylcobinamide-GDP ribazoletransferase